MSRLPIFDKNYPGIALLLLALVLSGWKIATRQPSGNFAVAPALPASPDPAIPTVRLVRGQEISPDKSFRFDAGFVSSEAGRAVHAASLVELHDGRLRVVWFSGSREGAKDVVIKTSVSDAGGLEWSPESTLVDRLAIERGLWRYVKKLGNPVIARAHDGSLYLWVVTVSMGGWAGSSITWLRSVDDGLTWNTPQRLVTSPFLNISTLAKGAPVFYANGDIGLPVYHEFLTKFAEVLRFDPQGKLVDKLRIPASQTDLQPVLLVSGSEAAQAFMRSGRATALMTSATTDAGKNWSPARATAWPNPDSAVAGVVTANGGQWLALNPLQRSREMLALLQSPVGQGFDGVRPWVVEASARPGSGLPLQAYGQLLGDELKARGASETQTRADIASAQKQLCTADNCAQEFSYPYLLQSRDGYVHLVYTWHRTRIKHVRLDPLQVRDLRAP